VSGSGERGALRIEPLRPADLADALRLSTEAGWNQTAADWARLLDLNPDGCFGGWLDGQLVATATAASYRGAATWIGMVIVARAVRRRGFGGAMLERALQHGLQQGGVVGLDATDLGRPVYLGRSFVDVAPIDRWLGALTPAPDPEPTLTVVPLAGTLPADALDFDRQACGLDRTDLLAHLARQPDAAGWSVREQGAVVGLAFLRPGRDHFHLGPVVAGRGAVLSALLGAAERQLAGRTVLVDAPRNGPLADGLAPRGLSVQRRLVRMTYGQARGILIGARVAAATAFEWG
jgi:GNAT superfamily N-acetyltransferase